MPDSTPANLGRSATDSLTELAKVGTASPQPGASPALLAATSTNSSANIPIAASTASSALRERSNSALPRLSTSASHFHAPWRFGDSRNGSRHRPALSATVAGSQLAQSRLQVHPPHLAHHSSSQLNKPLLRRPGGAATTSAATPASGSEVRLVKTAPVIETAMDPLKLERERQRAEARNKEIDTVFQRISDVASHATQKLDQVYYSILERMAILKSTLSNMQEIYDQAKGLNAQFNADADAVEKDVQEQAGMFNGFKEQTQQIEVLETRIMRSKNKMQILSDRLEAARERVRKLENQEAEVQKSISFQFRIAYAIVGLMAAFFLILLIVNIFSRPIDQIKSSLASNNNASFTVPDILQTSVQSAQDSMSVNVSENVPFNDIDPLEHLGWKDESITLTLPHSSVSGSMDEEVCEPTSSSLEDDPRLRLFDEL